MSSDPFSQSSRWLPLVYQKGGRNQPRATLQLTPRGEILVWGSLKAEAEHQGTTLATAGGRGPAAGSNQHQGHPPSPSPQRPADAGDPRPRHSCCFSLPKSHPIFLLCLMPHKISLTTEHPGFRASRETEDKTQSVRLIAVGSWGVRDARREGTQPNGLLLSLSAERSPLVGH